MIPSEQPATLQQGSDASAVRCPTAITIEEAPSCLAVEAGEQYADDGVIVNVFLRYGTC
jgi:hypothetical protein